MKKNGKSKTFEIIRKLKTNSSSIDEFVFSSMKKVALGDDYELSLVIIGKNEIKELNKSYAGINKPTDILSFPLSDNEGEIFICLEIAHKEAPNFDRNHSNFVKFLFIHGLIHLKGFKHSDKMESEEEKIRRMFNV